MSLRIVDIYYRYVTDNIAEIDVEVANDSDRRQVACIDVEYRMGMWTNPNLPGLFKDFYGCQLYVKPMYYLENNVDMWFRICTDGKTLSEKHNVMAGCLVLESGEAGLVSFLVALDGSEVPPPPWKDADGPYVRLVLYLCRALPQVSVVSTRSLTLKLAREPFRPPKPTVCGYTSVEVGKVEIDEDRGVAKVPITVTWHGSETTIDNVLIQVRAVELPFPVEFGLGGGCFFFKLDVLQRKVTWSVGNYYGWGLVVGDGFTVTIPFEVYLTGDKPAEWVLEFCGVEVSNLEGKKLVRPVNCHRVTLRLERPDGAGRGVPQLGDLPRVVKVFEWSNFTVKHIPDSMIIDLASGPPRATLTVKSYWDPLLEEWKTCTIRLGQRVKVRARPREVHGEYAYFPFEVTLAGRYMAKLCVGHWFWAFELYSDCGTWCFDAEADMPTVAVTRVDMPDPWTPGEENSVVLECVNTGRRGRVYVMLNRLDWECQSYSGCYVEAMFYRRGWSANFEEMLLKPGEHVSRSELWNMYNSGIYFLLWYGEVSNGKFKVPLKFRPTSRVTRVTVGIAIGCERGDKVYITDVVEFTVDCTGEKRKARLNVDVRPSTLVAGFDASLHVDLSVNPPFAFDRETHVEAVLEVAGKKVKTIDRRCMLEARHDRLDRWIPFTVPDLGLEGGRVYTGKIVTTVTVGGIVLRYVNPIVVTS